MDRLQYMAKSMDMLYSALEPKATETCEYCGYIGDRQGDDNYSAVVCGNENCQQEFQRIYANVISNLGDVYSEGGR